MTFPGPDALGRGLVLDGDTAVPGPFSGADEVVIDETVLSDPTATVDRLHSDWLARRRVVIRLRIDADRFRQPVAERRDPWLLGADFDLPLERLQFLVWSNTYDGRGDGDPRWWWAAKAKRASGGQLDPTPGGPADAVLDGQPVWCDGGPRQPLHPDAVGGFGVVHRDSIEIGGDAVRPGPPPGPPTASNPPLAPDQLEAVAHLVGPSRVIAPAGSGKTRVLTARLRHLLGDRGWERGAVAAVAYNKAAADELVERTGDLGADIRTLNSFALGVMNGNNGFRLAAGTRLRQTLADEREVRELVAASAPFEPPRVANTDPWVNYLEGLRAIRLALRDPAEVERAMEAPGLAELFPRYRARLADKGVVDFDGQVDEALRGLLADPQARLAAQLRCRHLLVDEFQDLTPAHVLLLRLCAAPAFDVFAVGDDDQTIYGFGGASPRFLVDVGDFLPGAASHALEVNYRCPPAVVTAAAHLLSYNHDRVAKTIRPAPDAVAEPNAFAVRLIPATSAADEVQKLVEAWRDGGGSLGEVAVLARVNAALLPVQVQLSESGIACRAAVGPQILERTGVRTALAYLRIALDPGRIAGRDVLETVRRPSRKIAPKVAEMMVGRRGATSVTDLRRLAGRLTGKDGPKVLEYASDLEAAATRVRTTDSAGFFSWVRTELGLGDVMDVLDGGRRELDRSTHGDDLVALEQVAALHPDASTFETWLRDALKRSVEAGRAAAPGEGVEVSTVHRVKGLQWPLVVVAAVDSGMVPHRRAEDEEEERRILHVAITRAASRCVVLADEAAPSPFLTELDGTRSHAAPKPRVSRLPAPATPAAGRRGRASDAPSSGPRLVEATVGAVITRSGHDAEVVEVRREGALVSIGRARETFRWGAAVSSAGTSGLLAPPGVEAAVREWRSALAKVNGAPAYTILSDADLAGIVATMPSTLTDLAHCRGIGPAKLERFGDELLAVLDDAFDAVATPGTED